MFLFTLSFCFLSVSILKAINSLDQIMAFIKDLPEDFTTKINNVVILKNLKSQIKSFYKIAKNKLNWIIGWDLIFVILILGSNKCNNHINNKVT